MSFCKRDYFFFAELSKLNGGEQDIQLDERIEYGDRYYYIGAGQKAKQLSAFFHTHMNNSSSIHTCRPTVLCNINN